MNHICLLTWDDFLAGKEYISEDVLESGSSWKMDAAFEHQ